MEVGTGRGGAGAGLHVPKFPNSKLFFFLFMLMERISCSMKQQDTREPFVTIKISKIFL